MINAALESFRKYPEVYRHPLAGFDDEIRTSLVKYARLPEDIHAMRGAFSLWIVNGELQLVNCGRDMQPISRKKVHATVKDFISKIRGETPKVKISGLLTLYVSESGIVNDRFRFCGLDFHVTADGVPVVK